MTENEREKGRGRGIFLDGQVQLREAEKKTKNMQDYPRQAANAK